MTTSPNDHGSRTCWASVPCAPATSPNFSRGGRLGKRFAEGRHLRRAQPARAISAARLILFGVGFSRSWEISIPLTAIPQLEKGSAVSSFRGNGEKAKPPRKGVQRIEADL